LPEADLWWMSPPCTPFTRRGNQRDDKDPRALALLHLIDLIPEHKPAYLLLENVAWFRDSKVCARLHEQLERCEYTCASLNICSSQLGVPMLRPRFFILAQRDVSTRQAENTGRKAATICDGIAEPAAMVEKKSLCTFLDDERNMSAALLESLLLPQAELERYKAVLNIVDPQDEEAYAICFTRGYFKCRKASGSLLQMQEGGIRFFSPNEILRLLGFSSSFTFPESMPLSVQFKLLGNSVDVRAIKLLLQPLLS